MVPFTAPFPLPRAPPFCSDGSDHTHQRRRARAGQPAVQEDEEDPLSGNYQRPHTGRRRGGRGTSSCLSTIVFDPFVQFSPVSALLLYSRMQKTGKDHAIFFVCVGNRAVPLADGHSEQYGELSVCALYVHQRQLPELLSQQPGRWLR